MEYNVNINGIDVHASYSAESIDTIFKPLLHRLSDMRKAKNARKLTSVLFPAPGGAASITRSTLFLALRISENFRSKGLKMASIASSL